MLPNARRSAATCLLVWLASVAVGAAGCRENVAPAPEEPEAPPRPVPRRTPMETPEPVPAWVAETPRGTREEVFFAGWVEGYYADPYEGFEEAQRRALAQVANSVAVHVSSKVVVYEDERRQEVSSEIRTWASEYVRKLPGRKEYRDEKNRRYHVLISVPRSVVEPTGENLARFIRKNYRTYASEGEDRKALASLKSLVRIDPSPESELLLFDYLVETERWTAAKARADVLSVELAPESEGGAKIERMMPLLAERSRDEPRLREAKRKKRLAGMRLGVAAFLGRDAYPELESQISDALRAEGVNADGVSGRLASVTLRRMTENVDLVRGLVGKTSSGDDFTHVVVGQAEVLWLMKKKVKGGSVDYYVSFVSGAFIDLKEGIVLESFVRDAVDRAGVRGGEDLEARARKCKMALGANAAAGLAGRLPRLVREYVERR